MHYNFKLQTFSRALSFTVSLIAFLPTVYGRSKAPESTTTLLPVQTTAGCGNISPFPCSALRPTLPFYLVFDSNVSNSLVDKTGMGTGFTMARAYSGTRLSQDGRPSMPEVPGYEASRITLSGGRIRVLANKGVDFKTNNNLINSLGVQAPNVQKMQIEVKVVTPYQGSASAQGGLWFGINDKTYIKLGISERKIELRKEVNDISSTVTNVTNPDQRATGDIPNMATKTVRLRMVIDFSTNRVEGFYSLDGITYTSTGTRYSTRTLSMSGMGMNGNNTYTGIFSTYRDAPSAITYSFDDFSIEDATAPASQFQDVSVNFRPQGTAAPAGFIADNGLPFDAGRKYGWVNPSSKQPIGLQPNMRLRTGSGNASQLSLVQMQANTAGQVPGSWQYALPNGFYHVTVSAGDNGYYDSNHQVNVQGLPVVSDFSGNAQNKFRVGTSMVQVNDGKMTIDALGGTNTKLNYVMIKRAVSVTDATAPTASARFVGTAQSANTYLDQVQIFMTAADAGGSGLKSFQYALDGNNYINYTAPFGVSTLGSHTLKIKVTDGNNNQTITNTYNFTITQPSRQLAFSKTRLSYTILRGNPVQPQTVSVSPGVSYTLTKSEAAWLTLPSPAGTLTFGPQQINSNLGPGKYEVQVNASANGYETANLVIDLEVLEPKTPFVANVNFQDAATIAPVNYLRDFGQAFNTRMDLRQSVGLQYGWKQRSNGAPLDLSGNGRNRQTPQDILLATILHMQANHITTNFQGNKTEGYWEMKVPNGTYSVTVSVGDGLVNSAPELHTINVEGIRAINAFQPSGKQGTISRFKTATVQVNVTDELLTIDADGGTNTKITNVNIAQISISPYLYWSEKTANMILDKTGSGTQVLPVTLGRSDNASATYSISATYGAGATNWLSFSPTVSGMLPTVSIDYTALRNQPLGVYKATIKATSGTATSATFDIQVNVVDKTKPYVISSTPANGATNVSLNNPSAGANNLSIPSIPGVSGVNNSTITTATVFLYKIVNGQQTALVGKTQGSIGGDVISKSSENGLEPNTTYKFVVTSGVKSALGDAFAPYEATFSTEAAPVDSSQLLNAQFQKMTLSGTQGKKYTSLAMGPDKNLYALRVTGEIEKMVINHSTGLATSSQVFSTLPTKYGARTAVGMAFDPASTAANPIVWVTHSKGVLINGPEFDGNLSRLSGASLQNEELVVQRLPRSMKDHLSNGLAFGPDGALYICQGSMNSAGYYDTEWQRDETLLSASVLRLDISKLGALPLNVQTTASQALINAAPTNSATFSDGTYNPYAVNSPLTIFASGVRNAYDLVWHSNGQLYLPTNGSGGQGVSPFSIAGTRKVDGTFYNGPIIDSTRKIQPQTDWLFRANPNKTVGYYGHPNPMRGEFVLNRGYFDNDNYLPTVAADPNFRAGYNFGENKSPNGIIEYKSNTFGGKLKNKLMVVRFSGGGDIAVLEPGSLKNTGNVADDSVYDIVKINTGSGYTGLVGMSGFANPIDIVEDLDNGNLYISEFNWNDDATLEPKITLLKVGTAAAPPVMGLTATARTAAPEQADRRFDVALSNDGEGVLEIKDIRFAGTDTSALSMEDILLPSAMTTLKIPKDSVVNFQVLAASRLGRMAKGKLIVTSIDNTVKEIEINPVDAAALLRSAALEGEAGTDHNMTVYPNPTLGNPVNIRLDNFNRQEPVTIYLYDLKGNVVKTVSGVTDSRGEFNLQLADKSRKTGSYIVKVVYLSGYKFAKVIHVE